MHTTVDILSIADPLDRRCKEAVQISSKCTLVASVAWYKVKHQSPLGLRMRAGATIFGGRRVHRAFWRAGATMRVVGQKAVDAALSQVAASAPHLTHAL